MYLVARITCIHTIVQARNDFGKNIFNFKINKYRARRCLRVCASMPPTKAKAKAKKKEKKESRHDTTICRHARAQQRRFPYKSPSRTSSVMDETGNILYPAISNVAPSKFEKNFDELSI